MSSSASISSNTEDATSPSPITTTLSSDISTAPSLPSKVYTSLITNTTYLSGLLSLDYALKKVNSAYPLVALYTDTFPKEGLDALRSRQIPHLRIPYLLPSVPKEFTNDPRFYDCWSKLTPFGLTQFTRIVQLDSDMLILRNMDELFDIPLDNPSLGGTGSRVFAASHACVCNPLQKPHYPRSWVPEACAFTSQHAHPDKAQIAGAPSSHGLAMPNGGLQVVRPSSKTYSLILSTLQTNPERISSYDFADQSLLGDIFHGRWVPLPYTYNALKTLRWKGVHHPIWRDDEVKCLHFILSPKPWDTSADDYDAQKGTGVTGREEWDASERVVNKWWRDLDRERRDTEVRTLEVEDGY